MKEDLKIMKTKLFLIAFSLLFLFTPLFSNDEDTAQEHSSFIFSQFFLDHLPGAYFYPSFFENFAPDTTFLIEESNGFSLIDSPRVYFEGDSFINFNWFYNGHTINSVLDAGSPAVLLPFSSISQFDLKGEAPFRKDYGFNFLSKTSDQTSFEMKLSNVWPNMGGLFLGAKTMVHPHATTEDRNPLLYSERRKIHSNSFVDLYYFKKFETSALFLSLDYFDIKRQFNDFNTYNAQFREGGKYILMNSGYEKEYPDGFLKFIAVFNSLSRDKLFAELGRLPQETQEKGKRSLFSGIDFRKKNINLKLSFLYENEDLVPNQLNLSKDLKDNDGGGFFPFEKRESFSASVLRLNFNAPFQFSIKTREADVELFADFKFASLKGHESTFDQNPLFFDASPYRVVLWESGQTYRNSNANVRMGTIFQSSLSEKISVFAKGLFQFSSLRFRKSENNLSFFNLGFDLGILLFKGRNPEILLSYGHIPYELRENVNFFLERLRPGGTIHLWNDENHDLLYQSGEEGQIYGFTGGPFHSVDERLRAPTKKRLLLSLSTRLSQKFRLNVKGIFKRISNNFWIKPGDDYGFFESAENVNLYFLNQPASEYVLSNENFSDFPFYAQLLLHIKGQEERKWFFSFSFMAHIGMGYTAFGNGPAANDIGLLDESQADPNSWINGYGRVDGDRAFVGKMYFGFYLMKDLFLAASLKYRDGTPFAFINTDYSYNQRILYLQTIQAENWKGIKGGPREDYVSDVSINIRYSFKMFNWGAEFHLTLFNVFDFGSELSEYVFSGGSRYAMELQIPRSLRAALVIKL